jgi:ferredoxin-fold anticodon binding domain-containing protein
MSGNFDRVVESFFKDPSFKVLGIKGAWGVGKTYFWNQIISRSPLPEEFGGFFYASIFGLKSLGDIKQGLVLNYTPSKVRKKKFLSFISKKPIVAAGSLMKKLKVPYIGDLSGAYAYWMDEALQNAVVCIDDIERGESSVSFSEILGFVSTLTELRGCKVVLIYNDQKIDESKQRQIDEYREKVIDLEILYNPKTEENLSIVWPNGCPENVSNLFVCLELKNIRVMQKTRRAIEFFSKIANESCPRLLNDIESQVCRLAVLYYVYSNTISLEEVIAKKAHQIFFTDKASGDSRLALLKKINYWPQDYDRLICDYLVNGYVELSEYLGILDQISNDVLLRSKQEELQKIWSKFHSNFTVDGDVFALEMRSFLIENGGTLTLGDVTNSAYFLKEIAPSVEVSDIIDFAVDSFLSKSQSVDIESLRFYGINTRVIDIIKGKINPRLNCFTLHEMLNRLAGSNSWNSGDIERIRIFSQAEWLEFLKTCTENDLIALLKEFLQRFGASSGVVSEVVSKISIALNEIGEESFFNKIRIKGFAGLVPQLGLPPKASADSTPPSGDCDLIN